MQPLAHVCRLELPNSYAPDDGKEVSATAVAADKETASEDACCTVFARLCSDLRGLPHVIFRSRHYNVSIQELVDDIVAIINNTHGGGPSATVQPLAEHHASSGATFEGTRLRGPSGGWRLGNQDWQSQGQRWQQRQGWQEGPLNHQLLAVCIGLLTSTF